MPAVQCVVVASARSWARAESRRHGSSSAGNGAEGARGAGRAVGRTVGRTVGAGRRLRLRALRFLFLFPRGERGALL